ncbi:MAG: hypothetical protein HC927_01795 [Deltaproteobacteria bacterium]|nr:hypothetical protein [Deltaproteobacteria bacterium]
MNESEGKGECRVPEVSPTFRDRLLEGFGVDEFPQAELRFVLGESCSEGTGSESTGSEDTGSEPDGSCQQTLDWTAPAEARYVACALFTCPPVIAEIMDSASAQATGPAIINFDRCVAAHALVSQPAGSFDWRDPSNYYVPPESKCSSSASQMHVSALLVGCWAYDEWRLIGATKLFSLAPVDIVDAQDLLANGDEQGPCSPDDVKQTRSCLLAGELTFGTCAEFDSGRACLPRCLDNGDCLQGKCEPIKAAGEKKEFEIGVCR